MVELRKAVASDSRSILEVNVKTWCVAYKGIIPEDYLQYRKDTIEEQIRRCEETVEDDNNVYVALENGNVVGIMSYGPSRTIGFENYGEIYTLYVLNEHQKKGIGTLLLQKGIQELKNMDYNKIIVNCLKDNKSNDFYIKFGSKIVGVHETEIGGKRLAENTLLFNC